MIIWGRSLAAAALVLLAAVAAGAQTVAFDLDTGTPTLSNGMGLPIDQTSGGITAHFSTPSATSFSIQSDSSTGWKMTAFTGHYLYPNGWNSDTIDVQFSQLVTSFTVAFATAENQNPVETPSSLAVTAYVDSVANTPVASVTGPAAYLGDTWPTGVVALTSTTPFNIVRLKVAPNVWGTVMFMADSILVTPATPRTATRVYAPGVSAAPGQAVALNGWLMKADKSASVPGKTLHFTVNGTEIGTGTTDSYGRAQAIYTVPAGSSGSIPFSVAFTDAADPGYLTSLAADSISVQALVPTRVWMPGASGAVGQTITLQAWLLDTGYTFLPGQTLAFSINGTAVGSGVTDATGRARVSYTVASGLSNPQAVDVTYAGDTSHAASSTAGSLALLAKMPTRVYVVDQTGAAGTSVSLVGWLLKVDKSGYVAGKTLHFLIDEVEVGTGVTDGTGKARYLFAIPSGYAGSTHALRISFTDAADPAYDTSTGTANLTVP